MAEGLESVPANRAKARCAIAGSHVYRVSGMSEVKAACILPEWSDITSSW
jgi:hypothetical protein